MERITWHPSSQPRAGCFFSIIIPSWNNLHFLKKCVESIEKHSTYPHQIIIHINEGNDGTLEWVREKGYDYTYSVENAGVCWAMNACRSLMRTDYLVFVNDDMYVLPDWDRVLWEAIEKEPDPYFFLSGTLIEPKPTPHAGIIAPYDYGTDIASFREEALLAEYKQLPGYDWMGATWPPNVVHKHVWDLVGGYSIEFFPGMYSDPDFSMKLLQAGVRRMRGLSDSRVYHFGCKSTGRVKRNDGSKQFLMKWGITSSTLTHALLRRGEPYQGDINIKPSKQQLLYKLKSRFKKMLYIFSDSGIAQ